VQPVLMHCSYHKCMTVYFSGIVGRILGQNFEGAGYAHFNSDIEDFYAQQSNYELASVNNHAIDLSRYKNYRVTRLIRDPRDLVVSGYFYHHRIALEIRKRTFTRIYAGQRIDLCCLVTILECRRWSTRRTGIPKTSL